MIHFDLASKDVQVKELEAIMLEDGFWDDHKTSSQHIQKLNRLKKEVEGFAALKQGFDSCQESVAMLREEPDPEFQEMVEVELMELKEKLEAFSLLVLLSEDYDTKNAIVEIHPGAGGT